MKPTACALTWPIVIGFVRTGFQSKYILWQVAFIKGVSVNSALVKADENTFRKWALTVDDALSSLQLVSSAFNLINAQTLLLNHVKFSCRKRLLDEPLSDCYLSVDGTD